MVAVLWLVVLGGVPVVLLAQRMSASGLPQVFRDEGVMLAIAVTACASVLCWQHLCQSRLLGWMGAACSTVIVAATVRLVLPSIQGAAALTLIGAAAALMLAARADSSLRYLSEQA